MATKIIEASDMQKATKTALEDLSKDGDGKLREDVDRATLYEISAEYPLDLSGYRDKYNAKLRTQAMAHIENVERAEFERLKSKYGREQDE